MPINYQLCQDRTDMPFCRTNSTGFISIGLKTNSAASTISSKQQKIPAEVINPTDSQSFYKWLV